MTKAGIEHDLPKSPYVVAVSYYNREIRYYFSTQGGMEKFEDEIEINRESLINSLSNRFKMKFVLPHDFCDIQLYKKIERRGFYIEINGEAVRWLAKMYFDGTNLEVMSSKEK